MLRQSCTTFFPEASSIWELKTYPSQKLSWRGGKTATYKPDENYHGPGRRRESLQNKITSLSIPDDLGVRSPVIRHSKTSFDENCNLYRNKRRTIRKNIYKYMYTPEYIGLPKRNEISISLGLMSLSLFTKTFRPKTGGTHSIVARFF